MTDGASLPVFGQTMVRLQREWTAEVCYCSTLDQCWVADASSEPPREVQRCDDQPPGEF